MTSVVRRLVLLVISLVVVAAPVQTIGWLADTVNQASFGVLEAFSTGSTNNPQRALGTSLHQLFVQSISRPWCWMEFGDSGPWCTDPGKVDADLTKARTQLLADGQSAGKVQKDPRGPLYNPRTANDERGQDLALLSRAHANGEMFLAFPVDDKPRNAAAADHGLFHALCQATSVDDCTGPNRARAQQRSQRGVLLRSTAGAVGPMQFLPSTFATYGVAVGHRGAPDINRPADAIYAAANYLHASGAPADWGKAIFAYNHAGWYVDDVTRHAHEYAAAPAGSDTPVALQPVSPAAQSNTALGADTVLWTQRGAATTYGWDPVTHYVDPNDANNPSLPGATNDIAGISLLRQDTKGGWFRITAPNHITAVLQQTDYGPSTSALIDINAVAARIVFHYPEGNAFPSYAGTWTVSYLGMRRPPDAATPEQGFGLHPNPQLAAANTTTAGGGCPAPNCGPGAQTPNPLAAQTPFGALPDPGGNAVPDEHGGGGFTPGPGTDYTVGQEPQLARRLDALGRALHLKLTGISGYRTPQHSVSVGGFADDPHTRGQASDTPGIQGVAEATLNRFGLTRPFPGASEADHIQLQNGGNGAGALPAGAAAAATPIACQNAGAAPTIPGDQAHITPDGHAQAPANAPPQIARMIAAGNQLIGKPYQWSGGHSTLTHLDTAYDCSGAVSWTLHGAGYLSSPEDSTALETFGQPGPGRWVTVYANSGHTFVYVAGIRMDTSPNPPLGPGSQALDGPRWRPIGRDTAGFVARHPPGL